MSQFDCPMVSLPKKDWEEARDLLRFLLGIADAEFSEDPDVEDFREALRLLRMETK